MEKAEESWKSWNVYEFSFNKCSNLSFFKYIFFEFFTIAVGIF